MNGLVWLASYPKSGNTWLRVFLANLRADGTAPADINQLGTTQFAARELWDRAIGWETAELLPAERAALRLPLQDFLAIHSPEIPIKTHEAFADPATGRPLFSRAATRSVLYVVRNPLDIAVSLSHHNGVSLDAAIDFMADPAAALPFGAHAPQETQLLCDWSTHVQGWLDAPGWPVCLLRYEDLLASPESTFARAAWAAGESVDAARIARAVARSRFAELQQQESAKGFAEGSTGRAFFRAGRSGDWRDQLTARQVERIVARHGSTMQRLGYLDSDGTMPH